MVWGVGADGFTASDNIQNQELEAHKRKCEVQIEIIRLA